MSFYSVIKYILKNKEYNAIIAWYKRSIVAINPIIWKEFVNRVNLQANIDTFEYKELLYKERNLLAKLSDVFEKSNRIIHLYSDVYNIFLEENRFVNPDTFKGREHIVFKEREMQSIKTIMTNFKSLEVQKNMLSGYICFFDLTFEPKEFPYSFQKKTVDYKDEVIALQNCIRKIRNFEIIYPKTFPFLLQAFEDPHLVECFKDDPILRLKRSEIKRIAQMGDALQITENYITKLNEFKNQVLDVKSVMNFTEEGIREKKRYLENIGESYLLKSNLYEYKDEVEEFWFYINKIKQYKNKYPRAYSYLLQAFTDSDLVENFKDNQLLRLKRSEIKRIAQMENEMQITEHFILVSTIYNDNAIKYITDSVNIIDFSPEGIAKKQQLLNYGKIFSRHKPRPDINLLCDIEDYNVKIRCIFSSELDEKKVTPLERHSINDLYSLASRIKKYGKTFDEIVRFRNDNSKAIKSYNEKYYGVFSYCLSDFDLIGSNNKTLMAWIVTEIEKEQELNIVKEKVNEIKRCYPNGFQAFIDKVGYIEHLMELEELQSIVNSKSVIHEYEIIDYATELISTCPNGVFDILGISYCYIDNIITAKKIIDAELQIRSKQAEYDNKKRIEEEQKERINEAKNIASLYPNGYKKIFPDTNINYIDYRKANEIISYKSEIVASHNFINRINNAVSGWDDVKGIPYYYFYHYYPTRFTDVTSASREVRGLIYNFKDGTSYSQVLSIIKQKLNATFIGRDLSNLCFVCIPASTKHKNSMRYESFSRQLCSELDMYNGYEHIRVVEDKTSVREGGTFVSGELYDIDNYFFNGKYVILFDDVVTRGRSMQVFKQLLEARGATIVCALSIGRTYSDYYGEHREPHPWSGEL